MTVYDFLKFLHILTVITWMGAGILEHIFANRSYRSGDPQKIVYFTENAAWTGNRLFAPASGLALLTGILLVVKGPWGFGDRWIMYGLVGFGLTAILGSVLGVQSNKLVKLQTERGPTDPVAMQMLRRIIMLSRATLLILLVVVFNMVVKPTR